MTTILTHANQLAGTQAGQIFDYDEATEELRPRATFGYTQDIAEALRRNPIRKGEGVTGRAVSKRQPVQVPDIAVEGAYDSRLRDVIMDSGFRALLAVPLIRENQVMGALAIARTQSGEFPKQVVDLLTTLNEANTLLNEIAQRHMPGEPLRIEVVRLSKGEVAHLPLPFALKAALRKQQDFLYRDAHRNVVRKLEYPGHRKTLLDALIRETGDGTYVVRQQDAAFRCRPLEHTAIVCGGQPRILDSNDVEVAPSPQQGADDVVIEVLVRSEGEHGYGFPVLRRARRRARTPTGSKRCSLLVRTASDCAFLLRKYSSTSDGRRM